jgi:hypothetical protein
MVKLTAQDLIPKAVGLPVSGEFPWLNQGLKLIQEIRALMKDYAAIQQSAQGGKAPLALAPFGTRALLPGDNHPEAEPKVIVKEGVNTAMIKKVLAFVVGYLGNIEKQGGGDMPIGELIAGLPEKVSDVKKILELINKNLKEGG